MKHIALSAVLTLVTAPAFADLEVTFKEGAPKDRFTLTNLSACPIGPADVTIDLAGSDAGLIFDVTGAGAGVEVFQPFDLVAGQDAVAAFTPVRDGDNALTLRLDKLGEGEEVAFTIDVDDTVGTREITVSRSEISGASVRLDMAGSSFDAVFTEASNVRVPLAPC